MHGFNFPKTFDLNCEIHGPLVTCLGPRAAGLIKPNSKTVLDLRKSSLHPYMRKYKCKIMMSLTL